jgi:hypothetical protein
VERLADDRCGVDYTTLKALQPFAKAVLANYPGARDALAGAAKARADTLRGHNRVIPPTESLRFFCGRLRVIFNEASAHLKGKITVEQAWQRCQQFAMEVFAIAGIDHANFDAHPERLREYLGTDITID